METKTLEGALEKIREMWESSKARQTTPKPLSAKQQAEHKRRWLNHVLKIEAHHPQLKGLEDRVYEFCSGYRKNPNKGRRLLIYGENGTGKSHAARAVSRWAKDSALEIFFNSPDGRCYRKEGSNGYGHSPESLFRKWLPFMSDLKSGFKDGSYEERFAHAQEVELLILDDIGTDNDPSKFGVEHLYMLLEAREHKWTLITTNLGPDAWETRFERRIASRFIRNFTHVPLDQVPDYNSR